MNNITISLELKPRLQEERAKLHPIGTIKQFKTATLKLEKLKNSMHHKLHAAYALEAKIKEAAVLLKGQSVKAQGIYNAHLSATPMELSDPDMAPAKRSNQMAPVNRSNQMAPVKRSNQMAPAKRSNQMLPAERRNQKSLPNSPHIWVSTEGIASGH